MKIADLHQDILYSNEMGIFDRLYEFNYRVVVAAVFPIKGNIPWGYDEVINGIRKYKSYIKGNSRIITSFGDFDGDRLNVILGLEGGYFDDIKYYEKLYKEGIRLFGLTWNIPSKLSGSCKDGKGLTSLGREFLHWAKERRVIVDVAHCSYEAIYQSVEMYPGVIYSHGGILVSPKDTRNIDFELAKLIIEKGGIVGVGYGRLFFERSIDIYHLAEHIVHLHRAFKGGIVSGSDFFGLGKQNLIKCLENPFKIKNLIKLLPADIAKDHFWNNFANFLFKSGRISSNNEGP